MGERRENEKVRGNCVIGLRWSISRILVSGPWQLRFHP